MNVQRYAAEALGHLEIKDTLLLRQVLVVLNRHLHDSFRFLAFLKDHLHDEDYNVRRAALVSIRQLLDGRPIPGYRWVPLRKRRARRLRLKCIAFWLGMIAVMLVVVLAVTWLLGTPNPNGFPVRFLAVLACIIAFVAAIAEILGLMLRDPWEHS